MNGVMQRRGFAFVAVVLLGAALLAGCGASSEDSSPAGGISMIAAQSDFDITVWPDGKGAGEPERYTLSCPEPSGDHPDPDSACEAVYQLNAEDFEPVPPDAICTEIYGGPQEARIEGTHAGAADVVPVALDLSRENGCQIDLWDRFAKIVPQPAGS
jgi:subtilisin inhibitor-like